MHRTVGVDTVYIKPAEVNGTKAKSLRTSPEMPHRRQKSRARKQSLLGSQFVYIGVLSDNFAAVDVREELCYHSRPKKQNSRGIIPSTKEQTSSPEIASIKVSYTTYIQTRHAFCGKSVKLG